MECDIELKEPKPGPMRGTSTPMGERFIKMVGTLRLAQRSVEKELEPLLEVGGPDSADEAFLHLYVRVRNLSAQADALLQEMNEQGAPISLVATAEALSDHFWDRRRRIATML
jgi:hypothetical protein